MINKQTPSGIKQAPFSSDIRSQFQLKTEKGRQYWEILRTQNGDDTWTSQEIEKLEKAFEYDPRINANSADRLYRFLHTQESSSTQSGKAESPREAALKGLAFYEQLQTQDGNWPGDYGGPMFLLPGLIIASAVTETPFDAPYQALMRRYMLNHQNPDGGWGLHIEGESTMFGTAMQYVALRILGIPPDTTELQQAREWIQKKGGAVNIPSWGKFYLAVLGVYEWKGCQSLFPEMWTLPRWLPVHPGRYWCHARMVYLPMAYCYGHRVTGPLSELIRSLRQELYTEPYEQVNWSKARSSVAKEDQYQYPSRLLGILQGGLNYYEKSPIKAWRKKALDFILRYVEAEDAQTRFVDIGPVNQIINSICIWHAHGKDSKAFQQHVDRWKDYLWVAEDGMKMNGYNGSQLWDTAFAVQAFAEGALYKERPVPLQKAYRYLEMSQVLEDVPQRKLFFRHGSTGGWPFSTFDHGWPITDCTAEGVSATLAIHHAKGLSLPDGAAVITKDRLQAAIDLILTFQNKDGGWATYENKRGPSWLEWLNPSEVFGGIMVDYSYTECSSACIRALCEFNREYPDYRSQEIMQAVEKGIRFIRKQQREDGSWFGSWAVCFTYGTWFGLEALKEAGVPTYREGVDKVDPAIRKACTFLIGKQRLDGGWGESFESCLRGVYIEHEEAQLINTSWALLSLLAAGYPDRGPIDKGIRFLMDHQEENGDWPQQGISGVFNRSCMITYTAYRNIFPIWALGRYYRTYGNETPTVR